MMQNLCLLLACVWVGACGKPAESVATPASPGATPAAAVGAPAPAAPNSASAEAVAALKPNLRFLDRASFQYAWEQSQPLRRIMDSMGLKEGSKVAILGSGSGYLEFPIAKRVGKGGFVKAIQWHPLFSDLVAMTIAEQGIDWLSSSSISEAKELPGLLGEAKFDAVLWFDLYSPFMPPEGTVEAVAKSLLPGGRCFVFVERVVPEYGLDTRWSVDTVVDVFRIMGKDFPVYKRLTPELAACVDKAIADGGDDQARLCVWRRFLIELNGIAKDPTLYPELYNHLPWVQFHSEMTQILSGPNMVRFQWLLYTLGAALAGVDDPSADNGLEFQTMNGAILSSVFSLDAGFASPEGSPTGWHFTYGKESVRPFFEQHLSFEGERSVLADYDILAFQSKP
jgi:SAM-dependent methyltransferase